MSRDSDNHGWPPESGGPSPLPKEITPPAGLDDRVVSALMERRLIHADESAVARHLGWRAMRLSFTMAAAVALVAFGTLLGRLTYHGPAAPASPLSGGETNLYALLLYETEGYDRPSPAAALARYGEYSQWVAVARQRGQFVTGEDLEVESGWLLSPSGDQPDVQQATALVSGAPLSGIFFIYATDAGQALELASDLPHLRHGGQVLVQKTIPTDVPPPAPD